MKRYSETDGIERRLESIGHAQRRQLLLNGLVATFAWLLIGLAALFVLDWVTDLPFALRPVLVAVLLAYLFWSFVRPAWRQYRDPVDAQGVSLSVERAHPELQSRLISTLQFQEKAEIPKSVSENLVEGMIKQTFERVGSWSFSDVIDRGWWRRIAPVLGIAALLLVVQVVVLPFYTIAFYQRLIDPAASYPTRTDIVEVVGWDQISEGDSTPIYVIAENELPLIGRITLTGEDGIDLAVELKPTFEEPPADGRGRYQATLPAFADPAEMLVELGDDEWGPKQVIPRKRIRLETVSLAITPPAYTGQETDVVDGGNGKALIGSEVAIDITTTKDVASMQLVSLDEDIAAPQPEKVGPRHYRATFTMRESLPFTLELTDVDGLNARDIPRYRITAAQDRPPVIRMRRPMSSVELAPMSALPVEFTVTDDIGLSEVSLKYRVLDATTVIPEDVPVQTYTTLQPRQTEFIFDDLWKNERLEVREGNQIRVWVEARDMSPDGQITESSPFVIQVISAEAYRNQLWARMGEQIDGVDKVIDGINDSNVELDRLKKNAKDEKEE